MDGIHTNTRTSNDDSKRGDPNKGKQLPFSSFLRRANTRLGPKHALLIVLLFLALGRDYVLMCRHQESGKLVNSQPAETETASLTNNKKYLIYVMTLQGVEGVDGRNARRFDQFVKHWNILCGDEPSRELEFHMCPGRLTPPRAIEGFGLSMAYMDCFTWALKHHKQWHQDHGHSFVNGSDDGDNIPFVFLEDDARLYNSHFCHAHYRNRLWQQLPQTNATLLMLGGQTVYFRNDTGPIAEVYDDFYHNESILQDGSDLPQFLQLESAYGSYGFVLLNTPSMEYLSRKHFKMVNRSFSVRSMRKFKPIDVMFHQDPILQTYMSYPWLVYHEGGVYSNTKGMVRSEFGGGSKQYRWVEGLTGSFQNCSMSDDRENGGHDKSLGEIIKEKLVAARDNSTEYFQEGTVRVSCQSVTYRVPKPFFTSPSPSIRSSFLSLETKLAKTGAATASNNRILTAVISRGNRTEMRDAIRSTWAQNATDVYFLVDGPWEAIAAEFQEHHDLIWIQSNHHHHHHHHLSSNATTNTINMLPTIQVATFLAIVQEEYHLQYSFVLKVTDESYADLVGIHSSLNNQSVVANATAVWGHHCQTGVKPSHMGVPESEYSGYFFPEYCYGRGYALSKSFVECAVTQIPPARLVSIDDAYIGVLGERCGLQEGQFHSGADGMEDNRPPLLKHDLTSVSAMKRFYQSPKNHNVTNVTTIPFWPKMRKVEQ